MALRFVLVIGVVQLFADMTYEGTRSVNGAFLGSLGTSAAVVGGAIFYLRPKTVDEFLFKFNSAYIFVS